MPYDPNRKLFTPDSNPQQQPGWVGFDEDPQINAGPAVSAFKDRFMSGNIGVGNTPLPTTADLPMMDNGINAGGGAPVKPKSL